VLLAGPPASFLEKALIAGLLRAMGWRTLLCPRSGYLVPAASGSAVWRRVLAAAARLPDVVVVQSRSWQSFFTETLRVESDRVHVVPNWVATDGLPPRTRFPDTGMKRFVFAASFTKDKGIEDLVGVLPGLVPDLQSRGATFTLIGDGPEREAVEAIVAGAAPSVCRLPTMPRSEFLAFLAHQDVLVVPSRIEGMPNLVAEAMSIGLVVVAASVGGIPDVITSGNDGYLYEPGDKQRLIQILTDLMMRPGGQRISAMARKTAIEEFSAERNVRLLASLGCRLDSREVVAAGESNRGIR
jgi:glycosyltransferase involved in cell wall biosynthesis